MQQYLNNKKLKAFKDGQNAWNRYFKSGFYYPIDWYLNFYCKETEFDLWKEWNRGWNTNFNGIK
jgi:hypothetical protein